MCFWWRHFCNKGNILLNQQLQKTNCTIVTPGSSMCLYSNPFSRLQKDTHHVSTQLWGQGPKKDPVPFQIISAVLPRSSERSSATHPLRNRLQSPAPTAQPEALSLCHFPSPTPSSWYPGEGDKINSARWEWEGILGQPCERGTKSLQPKFTGNKSTHHPLLINY